MKTPFLFLLAASSIAFAAERTGTLPVGPNGKPLNFDFESGTLADWTATGRAFEGQPIKGDTVAARRSDLKSQHAGQYWIGTYERDGDAPQGALASVAFEVKQPWASFLMNGGSNPSTRVEIAQADSGKVIFTASGVDAEGLRPVIVDLKEQVGRKITIRLVDEGSGGWGHINFDDFRFHAQRPAVSDELDPKKNAPAPADDVKFAGLPPEQAAKEISGPPGFSAILFAGEPDVKQPIAFAIDDRGRLWVAEAYTYPRRAPEGQGKDRVLIFEDTDGDGKFDKRTVFVEGLNIVSGLAVGFGGVWIGAAPYLQFIPDRNHDDKPDGPPEILLDGWRYEDTHETLNTFTWGPDGWLYGCHGVFVQSNVGKPGAPNSERTRVNAGVWRYHPTRHKFELFSEGTSNPWGVDFDEYGQCHIEACVIPHFFHMIQGARYERQAGTSFNPNTYDEIKTIADHFHYTGSQGPHAANGRSDAAGGGHAHAGLCVYQGGSWPAEYRGKVFMNNIHGQRLNMDILERQGSGYVAHHGNDFINFNDRWSQILNMLTDQDGSMFMIDWYDKNQCHHNNVEGHDRDNGRIFKLVYNNQKGTQIDLTKKSDAELVDLQLHVNDFYVRHARRILQERFGNPVYAKDPEGFKRRLEVRESLINIIKNNPFDHRQVRALWALGAAIGLDEKIALSFLDHKSEYVRAWTIQFLCEDKNPSEAALKKFAAMARNDDSKVVRLYLASGLLRTAPEKRWDVLNGLLAHAEDANDHNLPFMYWYAAEGSVGADNNRAIKLLTQSKIPRVRENIARRIAVGSKAIATK
ncbi:MAG TPA: PVC-type heme-binding CxxCH protein [Verrucomicrobiae bacterium]|nr:PVC-type heme-binding CxxCH protein [Verrucomicrobiae bacterium]